MQRLGNEVSHIFQVAELSLFHMLLGIPLGINKTKRICAVLGHWKNSGCTDYCAVENLMIGQKQLRTA